MKQFKCDKCGKIQNREPNNGIELYNYVGEEDSLDEYVITVNLKMMVDGNSDSERDYCGDCIISVAQKAFTIKGMCESDEIKNARCREAMRSICGT